jgi:hypothetical protein
MEGRLDLNSQRLANEPFFILVRHQLKSENRSDQEENKKQSPKIGWFFKQQDADNYRAERTDARPDSITCSNRDCLNRLIEEQEAKLYSNEQSDCPPFMSEVLRQLQTGCKTDFKKARNYKIYPRHIFLK